MGYEFDAIRDLRGLHKVLHDLDALEMRQRVLDTIATLGVDVSAAPPPPGDLADAPSHTLVLWASDEAGSVVANVIPDAKISPALRDALGKTPFCFAGQADCGRGQWSAALRVMAALEAIGMRPQEFVDAYLPDSDDDDLPSAEELLGSYGTCADPKCVDLAGDKVSLDWVNHRFSVAYAFMLAM